MKKIDHTVLIIGLFVLFYLVLKIFPKATEHAVYSSLIFFALVFLSYWWTSDRYEKNDLYLLGLLALSLVGYWLNDLEKFQSTVVLQATGTQAFALITVVMLIGPVTRFFPKLGRFYFYRRHLGVTALLLAMIHAGIIFSTYFNNSHVEAFTQGIFTFYGFTGLLIMTWLGMTSWDKLQLSINKKWWQGLHTFLLFSWAYFAYLLTSVHPQLPLFHYYILAIFLFFWLVVSPYTPVSLFMKSNVLGWKQVHILVYIVYAAAVIHLVQGIKEFYIHPLYNIAAWTSVAVVVIAHSAGWIKKSMDDQKIYSRIKSIGKGATVKGKKYLGVAKLQDIQEGKGIKAYISKKPVALFKIRKEVYAVSDICPHQKGPLHQGRVIGNCVECPWHFYPYHLESGMYGGKQKMSVPVYDVFVKDDIVFVAQQENINP